MPGQLRTRFLKDRYIRRRGDATLYVKTKAFQPRPAPEDARLELSTVGIDDMDSAVIWEIGFEHYLPTGRRLHGRADVATQVFFDWDLSYVAQPEPTETHGSFIDWPDDAEDRLEIMGELADAAEPHRHPDGASAFKP